MTPFVLALFNDEIALLIASLYNYRVDATGYLGETSKDPLHEDNVLKKKKNNIYTIYEFGLSNHGCNPRHDVHHGRDEAPHS